MTVHAGSLIVMMTKILCFLHCTYHHGADNMRGGVVGQTRNDSKEDIDSMRSSEYHSYMEQQLRICALQYFSVIVILFLLQSVHPALPYPTLSSPILRYRTLPYPTLPCPTPPSPTLPCPALPCNEVTYPVPPSHPALSHCS